MKVDAIRLILQHRLEELQTANAAFSLRAYAERLGLKSGPLSEILRGKRKVTDRMVRTWIRSSLFDPQERAALARAAGYTSGELRPSKTEYRKISRAQWQVIAEWWHFAILSLMKTPGFQSDAAWIARRMGLKAEIVRSALIRLEDLGLIRRDAAGNWTRSEESIRTPDDRADTAIQKAHADLLHLAEQKLRKVPVDQRDFTSFIISFSPDRLPLAKEMIRKFQDELSAAVEDAAATEVYQLGVQLFPLSLATRD